MRFRVLGRFQRNLALSAAVIAIGGFTAGCSSDTSRFSDGMFTGSTQNQRSIIGAGQNQPYPGDNVGSSSSMTSSNMNSLPPASSGAGIQHSDLAPVASAGTLPPVSTHRSSRIAEQSRSTLPPVRTATTLDRSATGTVARAHKAESRAVTADAAPARSNASGWSREGGTEITYEKGETIVGLSQRFGVPAKAIVEANGLRPGAKLVPGQKLIIPAFSHGQAAAAAPDREAKLAESEPARKAPEPKEDRLATLPPAQKLKGRDAKGTALTENAKAEPQSDGSEDAADAKIAETDKRAKSAKLAKAEDMHKAEQVASAGGYTVKAGDSLYTIARKTGVKVEALKKANGLSKGSLHIGQTLKIPAPGETQVAKADDVDPTVTGTPGPSKPKRPDQSDVNDAKPTAYIPPQKTSKIITEAEQEEQGAAPNATGVGKMRWPVRGRIISAYGNSGGSSSDGIDIAVPEGTPIKAAENGIVIYAGSGLKDFGNTVLVRHEDGLVTVYGHASDIEVKRGEKVTRGEEIARSGMSGTTDTPKLHFEVRKNSAAVDPTKYLE